MATGGAGLKNRSEAYKATLKSLDTEENIDLYFYRPIGYMWALLAKKCGITPNAITVASIVIGVGAGVFFYFDNLAMNAVGMLLLVWANSFDSADGQLARMTGQYSRVGRILDGMSGDFWFASIYLAIILREIHFSPFFHDNPWTIWTLTVMAAIFHAKQSSTADYYRLFHLYFLKGEEKSELEDSESLRGKMKELSWRKAFFSKLFMVIYTNYTAGQEATSPAMQKLRGLLRERYSNGKIPMEFREKFRKDSLPLMKYANMLTFNWRAIVLFVSLFAGLPWIYPVAELTVFNAVYFWMVWRHEAICRKLSAELCAESDTSMLRAEKI